jgi:hypothetical protein
MQFSYALEFHMVRTYFLLSFTAVKVVKAFLTEVGRKFNCFLWLPILPLQQHFFVLHVTYAPCLYQQYLFQSHCHQICYLIQHTHFVTYEGTLFLSICRDYDTAIEVKVSKKKRVR